MLTLDLAMVTHRPEGIDRIAAANFPSIPGVRYVISWQNHNGAPIPKALLSRKDIIIYRFDKNGISLNRNNSIEHCTADIILFADDDIIYSKQSFEAIISTFENNPELDVATFRSIHGNPSRFPTESVRLSSKLPKNYHVASFEIAFRRETAGFLRCCPELGLGSPRFHAGEDEMFLRSAIKRGLNCQFFPTTICEHPGESTGNKTNPTAGNLRGSGCVIALTYPFSAFLRVPLKAWRLSKSGKTGFFRALRFVSSGALAAPTLYLRNRKYLW